MCDRVLKTSEDWDSPCKNVAVRAPCLVFYAHKKHGEHPPARAHVGIAVCGECSKTMTVKDVLTDEGWETLAMNFRKVGKAVPDRSRTELEWVELEAEKDSRHRPDCTWEKTLPGECEYRLSHHYCPHPEHRCSCPKPS
jgi:hypothetical protein